MVCQVHRTRYVAETYDSNMQLFLSRSTLADNIALFSPRDIYHWNSSFPDMEPNEIALRTLLMWSGLPILSLTVFKICNKSYEDIKKCRLNTFIKKYLNIFGN